MNRLRYLGLAVRSAIAAGFGAVRGDPDSSEGAVNLGLIGLSAGLFVAGEPALALIVPSSLLVTLGSLPAIAKVLGH